MKIPRCAPPWLMTLARSMVRAGFQSPTMTNFTWIPHWNTAVRWIHYPTYSVLEYQCSGEMDRAMRNQIMDAFTRACQKKLIAVVEQTEVSAICYYGGAPSHIQLGEVKFMKI